MVAEFQEVMKHLNRMCNAHPACDDCECPIHTMGCCGNIGSHCSEPLQAERIEKAVMEWAAEHPEPVYPTWGEYLISIGCLDPAWDKNKGVYDRLMLCASAIFTPIRSDIAVKLELEPKEGDET